MGLRLGYPKLVNEKPSYRSGSIALAGIGLTPGSMIKPLLAGSI
jgi:hypothetical protein